jgi:hypothetical protein
VSRGLARVLGADELEAVVRHELAHLRNRHHRDLALAAVVDAALGWVSGLRASTAAARLGIERSAEEEAAERPGAREATRVRSSRRPKRCWRRCPRSPPPSRCWRGSRSQRRPPSESPVAGRDVRPPRGARRRGVVRPVGVRCCDPPGCCDPPPSHRPARPLPRSEPSCHRRADPYARDPRRDGFCLLRHVVTNVLTRSLLGLTMSEQSVRRRPRKVSTMMWQTTDAISD